MNLDSIPHSCAHWCSSLSERTVFLPYFSHYIFQSPLGKVIKRELPIFFHTWKCTRTPEWWKCSVVKRGQCWLHSVSRSVVSTFIHVAYSQFLLSFTKTDVPSIFFFLMARLLSCPSCASVLRVRYCGLRNHRSHGKRPQLPKVPSLKPGGGQNIALYALPTDGKILPDFCLPTPFGIVFYQHVDVVNGCASLPRVYLHARWQILQLIQVSVCVCCYLWRQLNTVNFIYWFIFCWSLSSRKRCVFWTADWNGKAVIFVLVNILDSLNLFWGYISHTHTHTHTPPPPSPGTCFLIQCVTLWPISLWSKMSLIHNMSLFDP